MQRSRPPRRPGTSSSETFSLFAAVTFLLALVGLVSVVSLDVVLRSREFAVRLAVGADRWDILVRVLRTAGQRVLTGTAAGLLMAVTVSRWLGSLLFDVSPLDSTTYAAVIAIVSLVVLAAAYLPARRAASVDPAVLFRAE